MNQPLNASLWRVLLPHALGGDQLPDAETITAYKLAVADSAVEKLIAACASELAQLVKEAAADHFAHACVQGAATGDTTPAQWLEVQLGMLRSEIDLARKERATAFERWRAERDATKPLVDAVNRFSAAAVAECEALRRHMQAAQSNMPKKSRVQELREAGLTEEEIARLNLPLPDEEGQVRNLRERIQILGAQVAKCVAYQTDPLHDPEHVRGLVADHLVNAQLARAAAEPA